MKNLYISIKHNLITFSKTPASLILVTLPVLMLFVFGTIYPVTNILPQVITVSIITVSFSFIGIQFIEYRQNKFFRTNKSISMPNSVFILGTFITLSILLAIASFTLLTITWFFSQPIPILQQTVDNVYYEEIDPIKQFLEGKIFFSDFAISNINWFKFTYAMMLSVVMTSLFAIFVGSVFKSVKSFTVLTLAYLVLYIVLGGLALPYNVIHQSPALTFLSELIPNTHTNNLLSASMNEGHIENAYNYIYYTEAITEWVSHINDLLNDGSLLLAQGEGAIQGIIDTQGMPAAISAVMGDLSLIGVPEVEPEWLDPLKTEIVATIWPWISSFLDTLGDLLFNINIKPDPVIVLRIWYVIALFGDHDQLAGYQEALSLFNHYYFVLGDSLALFVHPDPFTLSTLYGRKTNLIPYVLILLTLPNFIMIKGEE